MGGEPDRELTASKEAKLQLQTGQMIARVCVVQMGHIIHQCHDSLQCISILVPLTLVCLFVSKRESIKPSI